MNDETMVSVSCRGSGVPGSADPGLAQEKFATLVRTHSGWVYAMARRQLGDPGLADDAAQMVFLALWRKHGRFVGAGRKIGGWLVQATHYACKDIRKMEARRKKRERRVAAMEIEHGAVRHDETMETDRLLKLDAALQRLSATDRTILVARFFQDQKVCDVAEQMRISEAAAEKRISRAVDRLRRAMVHNNSEMGRTETAPVAALLIAGAGPAPSLLMERLLQSAGGGPSAAAAHIECAARRILRHTSHLSAVIGTTAVAIVGLAAVPVALHFQHTSASARPGARTLANRRKARWPGEKKGVLTCVAYGLLTQRDFAWAVETSGTLITGKSGGIRAYDLSARVVRALARSQTMRGTVFPFSSLRWLHAPFYSTVHYNGFAPSPLGFGGISEISSKKPFAQITTSLEFQSHLRPYANFLRVQIRFDANSVIEFAAKTQRSIPYTYSGSLNIRPGHAVVLLRHVCTFQGKRWYSAVVFDGERYAYPIARKVPYMLDAFRYFRVGPAGFAKSAVISSAWNRYALAHPVAAAIPARWKKTFSNGATVAIAAINTHQWPLCSWTPDGQPLPDSDFGDAEIPDASGSVSLPNGLPEGAFKRMLLHEEVAPNGVAALFVFRLSQHASWAGLRWTQETQPAHTVRVGLDFGKWRVLGTAVLSPHLRRYFLYRGHRLVWNQVLGQARGTARGSHNSLNLFTQNIGERILSNAYRTVLKALNMGEIKDAYTLRDQVLAEIKKFRAAAK